MEIPTFITGNQNKADYLAKWLGLSMPHQKIDLDEIQALDLREVVEHKARQAYAVMKKPVLVEDVALTCTALQCLPGPFIKWFEKAGLETVCRMLDGCTDRTTEARTIYGLFDGDTLLYFSGTMRGVIAEHPRGESGFGFDSIFINEGQPLTRAEMDEATYTKTSYRNEALARLKEYIDKHSK